MTPALRFVTLTPNGILRFCPPGNGTIELWTPATTSHCGGSCISDVIDMIEEFTS